MSLKATVLFESPHCQVASCLVDLVERSRAFDVVTGFATVEGVEKLVPTLRAAPGKLRRLVIGAGTQRAFDAIDTLLRAGVEHDRVRIHLGHTRKCEGKYKFYRYHPMLHSKVFFFDMGGGEASVIIGSHNLTGFALGGLNGEAAVLLEGDVNHAELNKVGSHIDHCWAEAVEYCMREKEAYAWWMGQYLSGLRQKVTDRPRTFENKPTLVILCAGNRQNRPRKGQPVYFEIPSDYRQRAIGAEVHMYLFDPMPPKPIDAIKSISSAKCSVWGRVKGISDEGKISRVKANWHVSRGCPPELIWSADEYCPDDVAGVQQAWMKASYSVRDEYVYYFDVNPRWVPKCDGSGPVQLPVEYANIANRLDLIPPEHLPYSRVIGFCEDDRVRVENEWYRTYSSPEAGAFVLLSPRRAILS